MSPGQKLPGQMLPLQFESVSDIPSKGRYQKKKYLDREIVPIPSDTPTIETVSEHLDSAYW